MTDTEVALLRNILDALQDIDIGGLKKDVDEHDRILKGSNGTQGMVGGMFALEKSVKMLVKVTYAVVAVLALTHLDQLPRLAEWIIGAFK